MPSIRTRSPQTVSFAQRVARRWREGVVIANLSVAGYLAQLPQIEDAIFGPGMLTTIGIGVGAGLGWMMLRGALASRYDFSKVEPELEPDVVPQRSAMRSQPAASSRPRSAAPPAPPPGAHRPSRPPPARPPSQAPLPPPPKRSPSTHPYAHAQSGQTMMDGFPAPIPAPPPAAHAHAERHAAQSNQTGSTLHGYPSSLPPVPRRSSAPPPSAFSTRPGGLAAVASFPHEPGASRPSGPPTTRMTALQEAELAASPDAARPLAPASEPPPARLSWPPEIELSPESRSEPGRAATPPPEQAPMAMLARRMPSAPPANDGVRTTYIDTVGEPALTIGVNSSLPPEERTQARAALQRRPAALLEVIPGEANPPGAQLEPELADQLEELRAELLTMSPSQCFVIGVSSDGEHLPTKSALAVQLAQQLAQSGSRRVLLVEANATRPALDGALDLYVPLAVGFSQQMHRRMTAVAPSWMVLRIAPTLDVLAEGRFRTPGMLYGSVFAVALHELRDHYDVIVADGPVVETAEAAEAFAQVVDGIGYLTSGLPSIRVPRERALSRFRDKALFKVLTTR